MRVTTIYPSFMGEVNPYGIGAPCVFVRFAGCNLRCYSNLGMLCDTPESLRFDSGSECTVEEILEKVCAYGLPLVCITGGEPLCQDNSELLRLFGLLESRGVSVVVETNGSKPIILLKAYRPEVSYVVDYKGYSSGHRDKMLEETWAAMQSNDWLKFVLYNTEDIRDMLEWCENHKDFKGHVAAGLFWGSPLLDYGKVSGGETSLLSVILSKHPEYHIHLNMQTHKLISLYDQNILRVQNTIVPKDL